MKSDLLSKRKLNSQLQKKAVPSRALMNSKITTSEVVFLGSWMTTSGLGYKNISFVLTNTVFLSYPFPVPQPVRLGGEHAGNACRGEDRTTELADLSPAATRGTCCFPAFSPVLPASGSCALHILPFFFLSLQTLAPLGSSLRLFNSQNSHKTAGFLWLPQHSA